MSYTIRPSAAVAFKKAPAIAIAGPSGSGKTESAMRLARGYVGPQGKFLVIDTEEKRALYKRERYQPWDWMDFQPPFTPQAYTEALEAGRGYDAVIIDSASHEYSGPGGMQDMQLEDLERMTRGDVDKMQKLTAPAWKRAKLEHKKLMSHVIRYPSLLIMCFRAEPKIKFVKVKDERGREKTEIVDAGYQPICERMTMYEMLVSCLVLPEKPGVPQHIKRLEPDLEPVFVAGEQIGEATGERLAAWAQSQIVAGGSTECLTPDELDKLTEAFGTSGKKPENLLKNIGRVYGYPLEALHQIRRADFDDALRYAKGA